MFVSRRFGASFVAAMLSILPVGCGSSADSVALEGTRTVIDDAGDPGMYPDAAFTTDAAPSSETGPADPPKCAPGKDGAANVCIRVVRGADGPTINTESKDSFGIDGKGAVLVGLAEMRPSRDLSLVAQTWFPSESAGASKVAVSELPKVAEPLSVAPGTYYAFAVFRDQEPYMRAGVAVGDYLPHVRELVPVVVTKEHGFNVDVEVFPVRAVDVTVRMTTAPMGSGAGALSAWLVDSTGKVAGEGFLPCADLNKGPSTVRVFTTYAGTFDTTAALFDYAPPSSDASDTMPSWTPGTMYGELPSAATVDGGEWVGKGVELSLAKVEPLGGPKPADPSPTCTSAAYAPSK